MINFSLVSSVSTHMTQINYYLVLQKMINFDFDWKYVWSSNLTKDEQVSIIVVVLDTRNLVLHSVVNNSMDSLDGQNTVK